MSKQTKGHYVRIREHTQRAINKVIGKLQLDTGETQTADTALQYMIRQLFPEIAEQELPKNSNGDDEEIPLKRKS